MLDWVDEYGVALAVDSSGHEHRGKGEGGGQFTSTSSDNDNQEDNSQITTATESINSTELPTKQKEHLIRSFKSVVESLPKGAIERLSKNVKKYAFYADTKQLTEAALKEGWDDLTNEARLERQTYLDGFRSGKLATAAGAYDSDTGTLHLTGMERPSLGLKPLGNKYDPDWETKDVHAHEITHALDGLGLPLSSSKEWNEAWQEEIVARDKDKPKTPRLTEYGESEPAEGFAEFGMYLYRKKKSLAELDSQFPKCSALFRKWGLWL